MWSKSEKYSTSYTESSIQNSIRVALCILVMLVTIERKASGMVRSRDFYPLNSM